MGCKRSFFDDGLRALPFKQARQADYGNDLTLFEEIFSCHDAPQKPDVSDRHEDCCSKSLCHETFENDRETNLSVLAVDSDTSAPFSLSTSSSLEEDHGNWVGDSLSPKHGEFEFPLKHSFHAEDVYKSYLCSSPRRQVPLGPNHQADIPPCPINFFNTDGSSLLAGSDSGTYDDNVKKLMGTCIIPMPGVEVSVQEGFAVGGGRTDCACLDEGSIRCVKQHVKDSREKLRKSLGDEKFIALGFHDMGEEVTSKWSGEEEWIFRAVVYSNPASSGRNFWKHLKQVFLTRTTKDIVSYYFNVFMLRRRAAQNRSIMLNIDSDDDELHGIIRTSPKVQVSEEDEDSDIEFPDEVCDQIYEGEEPFIDEDVEEAEDSSSDGYDNDNDVKDCNGDTTGEDSGIDCFYEAPDESSDVKRFDDLKHIGRNGGSVEEYFIAQDDSCMSFEFEADNKMDSRDARDVQANHGNRIAGK